MRFVVPCVLLALASPPPGARAEVVVLKAARLVDGRGGSVLAPAMVRVEDDRIAAVDLGLRAAPEPADDNATLDLRTVRENAERQALITALARTDGNIVRAAELLGISRPTLYDMMNRLQIK